MGSAGVVTIERTLKRQWNASERRWRNEGHWHGWRRNKENDRFFIGLLVAMILMRS